MGDLTPAIATIPHAGGLEDLNTLPAYLVPLHEHGHAANGRYSCCFCGVGDAGRVVQTPSPPEPAQADLLLDSVLRFRVAGRARDCDAFVDEAGHIVVKTREPLTPPGGVVSCHIARASGEVPLTLREIERKTSEGHLAAQVFALYKRAVSVTESAISETKPTAGCIKLKASAMNQKPAFPVHVEPSIRNADGTRSAIDYDAGINRLADLVLAHTGAGGKTLVYASGQLDYFTIFAMQEVFRLLGIRNLTGNAEHCLNAGATHNEKLTGQEGPFLTLAQGIHGPNRMYLFNGWNGFVTHPPVFNGIVSRPDLDAYLVEVQVTESAKALAKKLGPDRILLIRPRTDPHLALAVAHEILKSHEGAIEQRFLDRFSDGDTFAAFRALASSPQFDPERVAERIAPEPAYVERLVKGIHALAHKMAQPDTVPINIPSVGLSQTSGIVAHCLWGSVMAMLGKYGLKAIGEPAGGTLRVPGQINAESEVQGLSRKSFFGRITMDDRADAAQRLGLPDDAYDPVVADEPRAALDYSEPDTDKPELFLFFGTQFDANMMGRDRWLKKLTREDTTFAVVDPIPDPFGITHADLILPSPPHSATTKLYQNGEWKLSLSVPQKQAAPQTRSDATILYDMMAVIAEKLTDPVIAAAHPEVVKHLPYIAAHFGPRRQGASPSTTDDGQGLTRLDGEVSRVQLWDRIQRYMVGGRGPLYCRPEHDDGTPIAWEELLFTPGVIYGGCGTTRFVLDYDDPEAQPFGDVFRRPTKFKFFLPTEADLTFPRGIILNSGRSTLTDDRARVRFATSTFNSGKATSLVGMPDDNELYVSPIVAEQYGLQTGGQVKVINRDTGASIVLPVVVTDRVKGETVYTSFHKSKAALEQDVCVNTVTSHEARCAYSGQTQVKCTEILLEKVVPAHVATTTQRRINTSALDASQHLPIWAGQGTPVFVTDIFKETHDVYTFRFQGDPLCRFVYNPGQFCTLVLNIDGKKVVRSYSISSTPTRPFTLEITIKRVPGGLVSNWLPDNLKVGDRVEMAGPKGKFCMTPGDIPPKVLLIGAGSGVTPVMAMARWMCDISVDSDIKFFTSIRSDQDFVFGHEIRMLTDRYRQFSPVVVTTTRTDSANMGLSGRIDKNMMMLIAPDLHERHLYMCGPGGFMDAVKAILVELDFDMSKLHAESFGGVRTSTRDKADPVSANVGPSEEVAQGDIRVQFARTGTSATTTRTTTLLEVAEDNDIDIGYACRAGSCGECKCRLLSGEVDMEDESGLTAEDKAAGYVLTCVATPRGDIVLDG